MAETGIDVERLAQLDISSSVVRKIVEHEGSVISQGSGPTESFCGCLTKRLKGSGMRWDTDNAESVMALASIYCSNQWDKYWKARHKAA